MRYLVGVLNSDLSLYNNMLLIICTKETYIYCDMGLKKKRILEANGMFPYSCPVFPTLQQFEA